MVHHESWKPIYLRVKRSKVKVTSHKSARVGLYTLVSVLTSSSYTHYHHRRTLQWNVVTLTICRHRNELKLRLTAIRLSWNPSW